MKRLIALLLAYLFLALAIIGIFLPGIPTVPFLLLTAWFAARGSDKLHKWLYDHPQFGKLLIDWEQDKAVSLSSKIIAVVMLCISWVIMFLKVSNIWLISGVTILFITVATFLITRPLPKQPNKQK